MNAETRLLPPKKMIQEAEARSGKALEAAAWCTGGRRMEDEE